MASLVIPHVLSHPFSQFAAPLEDIGLSAFPLCDSRNYVRDLGSFTSSIKPCLQPIFLKYRIAEECHRLQLHSAYVHSDQQLTQAPRPSRPIPLCVHPMEYVSTALHVDSH